MENSCPHPLADDRRPEALGRDRYPIAGRCLEEKQISTFPTDREFRKGCAGSLTVPPFHQPSGCRFRTRCPKRMDVMKKHDVWVSEPVPMFPFPGTPLYAQMFAIIFGSGKNTVADGTLSGSGIGGNGAWRDVSPGLEVRQRCQVDVGALLPRDAGSEGGELAGGVGDGGPDWGGSCRACHQRVDGSFALRKNRPVSPDGIGKFHPSVEPVSADRRTAHRRRQAR